MCGIARATSMHNRYQWQRYGRQRDMIVAMAPPDRRDDVTAVVQEKWLWHGTSDTDPMMICMGQDGVDARRVRRVVLILCLLFELTIDVEPCWCLWCSSSFADSRGQSSKRALKPELVVASRRCTTAHIRLSTVAVHTLLTLRRTAMRTLLSSRRSNRRLRSADS